jgi:MoaA/NifB/PqqE/SkfB family radical SAM enzyme
MGQNNGGLYWRKAGECQFVVPRCWSRGDSNRRSSLAFSPLWERAEVQPFLGELLANVARYCAPPAPLPGDDLDAVPCTAGHSFCYISPCGDVYPCVQFPLPSGNNTASLN